MRFPVRNVTHVKTQDLSRQQLKLGDSAMSAAKRKRSTSIDSDESDSDKKFDPDFTPDEDGEIQCVSASKRKTTGKKRQDKVQ